ncbi:MAG: protease pro-enzyme activation domain-containing protein [Thermoplasmata archaeon]
MRAQLAVVTALLVGLMALVPVASGHGFAGPAVPAPATGEFVTDAIGVPAGVPTVPLTGTTSLEVSLTLAYPHPAQLSAFLAAVSDPNSPLYRQYLTHAQFEATFAPSPSAVTAVVGVLGGEGAEHVTVAPDRLSVSAELSAAAVDDLFAVRMVGVDEAGAPGLYTAAGTPALPTALHGLVSAVSGLSNAADSRFTANLDAGPLHEVRSGSAASQFIANNTTGVPWFVGSDFTQGFRALQLFPGNSTVGNASYPTHEAVATLLASGYNQTLGENTPPWDPAVIDAYFNDTLAPGWPVSNVTGVPVSVAGVTPPLPGSFGNVNDSTLDEYENSLDLEMAGSLAPGAPLYNFYFGGSLLASTVSDSDIASYFDSDLAAALAYNYSPAQLGVVSGSFGIADLNDTTWNQELQEAASMGVTVVTASGDQGNAPDDLSGRGDGQWPIWPASAAFDTYGSVSVGGVSLSVSGTPAGWFNGTELNVSYDSGFGAITSLVTWWDTSGGPGAFAGSEGGVSTNYAEPSWQFRSAAQPTIVNVTVQQGAGVLGRAGPDVAFPANDTIAYVVADASGNVYFTLLEGTSIAAPAFAGFLADEAAVAHHTFGYLTPELYRIGSYYAANPGPTNPYYDVLNGSNYVFSAEPGWDATTGWGAPLAPLFFEADQTPAIRDYVYVGSTPGLPASPPAPPIPWAEIYIIFGVGTAVAVVLVVVMARPTRGPVPPPPPEFGALPPPPPPPGAMPGGATFLCPYCGAIRPAEPVRCPKCGAL